MITEICLAWIGFQINAPTEYFVLVGVGFFFKLISYGIKMYNKGKEDK